ncbi:MAG: type IV pilus assembly protein PilM [Nitrospirales bacterium]|nr:type IV pilus assembly protein PilM [Nitrospirales bacterium]
MIWGKKSPLGLDIGASYLKVVQLSDIRGGFELSLFDLLPLPFGVIEEGGVASKDQLTASLRDLMKKAGIKKGDAVVGISGQSSVIIKKITLPAMSEDELSLSIKYEAEQHIPFDIADVNIDFQIVASRPEAGQMDVALVAVKKAVIRDYVEAVQKAGLRPVIADVDALALANMYEANYESTEKGRIALIHAGASSTVITILQDGILDFSRACPIGSNHHTEAIERFLSISQDKAESLKKGGSIQGISRDDVETVINSASDDIYAEIYRSFEYYRNYVSEEGVDKIILSGGAALIKGFPDMMSERLSLPVDLANPFKKIKIPSRLNGAFIAEMAPLAAAAVGFAMRRVGDR